MLSSALIGYFTVRLNVELCSDWLFHSAAHFSSSHSRKETQGKYIFQYFLAQLYRWYLYCNIKCGHREPLLICGALKLLSNARSLFTFTFTFEIRVLTTHFTRSDAFQWCSGSVNHSPSSSVISPYSVYVLSEILCTVM